jgi:hypothetical protein
MRKNLVWVSANQGECAIPDLYNEGRTYDVAIHDYDAGIPPQNRQAEYWIPSPGTEKLETAHANLLSIGAYDQYAFLDDDLTITSADIDNLFKVGDALNLDLYQPALTPTSYSSHRHLFQNALGGPLPARYVPFVEIMCPFVSAPALQEIYWTFGLNQSAWGIDCYIWPKILDGVVVESTPIGHYRKPARRERVMRNGLTPFQELDIIRKIDYDGPEAQW